MDFLIPPVKRFKSSNKKAEIFPISFTYYVNIENGTFICEYIEKELAPEFGFKPNKIDRKTKPNLSINICRNLFSNIKGVSKSLREQAYRINWRPEKVVSLEAENIRGLFYGLVTIRQILANQIYGNVIFSGEIEDWPSFEWRGLQENFTIGREFNLSHAKQQVKRIAEMKGNLFQLYLETNFRFSNYPELALLGAMTPEDAKELDEYALNFFVTIIPHINTFGHLGLLLNNKKYKHLREKKDIQDVICPLHPKTRPLLKELLNDLMDSFSSPLIAVGLDEVGEIGTCCRCKKKKKSDIFLKHVTFLHGVVINRERRMLISHDMLLNRVDFASCIANGSEEWAEEVLNSIPKDIVICDWQYRKTLNTTDYFRKKKFEVFACPVFVTNSENNSLAFPEQCAWSSYHLLSQAYNSKASGVIQTTWSDGKPFIFDNNWLLYAYSLSIAWQPKKLKTLHEFATNWVINEMGIKGELFEQLICKLSIPLFSGIETNQYFNTNKKSLFYFAKKWSNRISFSDVYKELNHILEQERILLYLNKSVLRGRAYIKFLDVSIAEKKNNLQEILLIGEASNLYLQSQCHLKNNLKRKKIIKIVIHNFEKYILCIDAEINALIRVENSQGNTEKITEQILKKQKIIRLIHSIIVENKLISYEKIFGKGRFFFEY